MTIREKVAQAIDEAGHGFKGAAAITVFLKAAAEPDERGVSWHMRPDEATEEMNTAAHKRKVDVSFRFGPEDVYRAMLAVAPEFETKMTGPDPQRTKGEI